MAAREGHELVSVFFAHGNNDLFVRRTPGDHFDVWLRLFRVIDDFLNIFGLFSWQIWIVSLSFNISDILGPVT